MIDISPSKSFKILPDAGKIEVTMQQSAIARLQSIANVGSHQEPTGASQRPPMPRLTPDWGQSATYANELPARPMRVL
jgi:hypothetical protein